MTPLRRRMIDDMQLRNLAPKTVSAYVRRVAAFARHFGRSPEDLGPDEVRSYLLHLVQERHVSWSLYNQTVAALRFHYNVTLGRDEILKRIACPKLPRKLPVVLSPDEVVKDVDYGLPFPDVGPVSHVTISPEPAPPAPTHRQNDCLLWYSPIFPPDGAPAGRCRLGRRRVEVQVRVCW